MQLTSKWHEWPSVTDGHFLPSYGACFLSCLSTFAFLLLLQANFTVKRIGLKVVLQVTVKAQLGKRDAMLFLLQSARKSAHSLFLLSLLPSPEALLSPSTSLRLQSSLLLSCTLTALVFSCLLVVVCLS